MSLTPIERHQGFTLIELLAVLAILAGVVAGAVTGFGATAQETRLSGDENIIGSSADRFFDKTSPQVYPVIGLDTDGDGDVDSDDDFILPAGDLGVRLIDFDATVPEGSAMAFVPDFLKQIPDSAGLGSWRIDTNAGNVFFTEEGAALVKPSLARLVVTADNSDNLDIDDNRVQSNHVFTLTMRKDEAPINEIQVVIPGGYIIGGQGLSQGVPVGTLEIVFDANNPWDTGSELTVDTFDVVVVSGNVWAVTVDYDQNDGGTSADIDVKNHAGTAGELADQRTHTISITPPSGADSQGMLTLMIDRVTDGGIDGADDYKDPDVNEATETWTLTLFGTDGADGVDGGTNIITNPGTTGVFRWAAEENTAIDIAQFFDGMAGNQAVVIK